GSRTARHSAPAPDPKTQGADRPLVPAAVVDGLQFSGAALFALGPNDNHRLFDPADGRHPGWALLGGVDRLAARDRHRYRLCRDSGRPAPRLCRRALCLRLFTRRHAELRRVQSGDPLSCRLRPRRGDAILLAARRQHRHGPVCHRRLAMAARHVCLVPADVDGILWRGLALSFSPFPPPPPRLRPPPPSLFLSPPPLSRRPLPLFSLPPPL